MRKFCALVMAAAAIGLTSCGGQTARNADPDSLIVNKAAANQQIIYL